jgi:hypothetical protein
MYNRSLQKNGKRGNPREKYENSNKNRKYMYFNFIYGQKNVTLKHFAHQNGRI